MKIFLILWLATLGLAASDKPPAEYPEHGKVIGQRTATSSGVRRFIYRQWQAVRRPVLRNVVVRLQGRDRIYELADGHREGFKIGDAIEFRIDRHLAYIHVRTKEQKYGIAGVELKR